MLKAHIDLLQPTPVSVAPVTAEGVTLMVNAFIAEINTISTMLNSLALPARLSQIVLTVSQEQANALHVSQDMVYKIMHVFLKLLVQSPTASFVFPITQLNAKPAKVDTPNQTQGFVLKSDALALSF